MTGTGTLEDPYIITTRADLESIADNMEANYALGNDIDLSDADWTPIGFNQEQFWCDTEFTGSLDGRSHKIIGMTIHPTADWCEVGGLIGWISGDVKNLSIFGAVIYMPEEYHSVDGVGILCAETGNANIIGVSCSGTIYLNGTNESSVYDIGGIAGYNWENASFSACCVTLSLVVHGTAGYWDTIGGIVGSASSYQCTVVIINCIASISIASDSGGDTRTFGSIGGLVGLMRAGATLAQCRSSVSFKGDVTAVGASENYYFGGLVGRVFLSGTGSSFVRDSSSSGSISCTYEAGGLFGQIYLQLYSGNFPTFSVERCSANVNIHVGAQGGGAIGLRSGNVTAAFFTDCYALGDVHCHEPADSPEDCIGGFVGSDISGSVYTNCYSAGEVIGESSGTKIGGFAGEVWS